MPFIVKIENLRYWERMARPTLKNERREQILDAFETCVARYGVEGATLAKTADEAGLARPLVRHNVGNRDELLAALVDRYLKNSQAKMAETFAALPVENASDVLIDWLFDPLYTDAKLVQVASALISASNDNPELATKMRRWVDEFVSSLNDQLAMDFPAADPAQVAAVAAGVSGIYFNVEALYPLGDITALAASSKRAALTLLKSLETHDG